MTYIFFRDRHFYPVDGIPDDAMALKHVAMNPGTTRVEDINGRVVWPSPKRAETVQ